VLFFKAPARAKQRLAARLGADAEVGASHLLACALEDTADWPGPVVLAPASAADAQWLATQHLSSHEIMVQSSGSLGQRINDIDIRLRTRGIERVLFIGADCPALDVEYLLRAEAALDAADAVLGPARDGGVVLMGSRRPWPPIGDLAWSTPRLRADLLGRLAERDFSVTLLDTLADVDCLEDIAAAAADLIDDSRPARRVLLGWLQSVAGRSVERS